MSPSGELLHISSALIFFTSCTPVLEHLALKDTQIYILESQGTVTIRDSSWHTTTPGALYRLITETPLLSEEETYLSPQEHWLDEQTPGVAYS